MPRFTVSAAGESTSLDYTEPSTWGIRSASRTALKSYAGTVNLANVGAGLTGYNLTGPIQRTNAYPVILDDCWVGGGATALRNTALLDCTGAATGHLTVRRCRLKPDQPNVAVNGIMGHDYTAEGVDVSDTVDFFSIYNTRNAGGPVNVNIRGSYGHDFFMSDNDPDHINNTTYPGLTHNDGVQIQSGTNWVIEDNVFKMYASVESFADPGVQALFPDRRYGGGITLSPAVAAISGGIIRRNKIDGGAAGFQANADLRAPAGSIDLSENRFGRDQHDYGNGSRYQIRFATINQPAFTGLYTNMFDPDNPTVPLALRGKLFAIGRDAGIRTP